MRTFEVLPTGFDGSSDGLDHLVLWVRALHEDDVYRSMSGKHFESISVIDFEDHVDVDLYTKELT